MQISNVFGLLYTMQFLTIVLSKMAQSQMKEKITNSKILNYQT